MINPCACAGGYCSWSVCIRPYRTSVCARVTFYKFSCEPWLLWIQNMDVLVLGTGRVWSNTVEEKRVSGRVTSWSVCAFDSILVLMSTAVRSPARLHTNSITCIIGL